MPQEEAFKFWMMGHYIDYVDGYSIRKHVRSLIEFADKDDEVEIEIDSRGGDYKHGWITRYAVQELEKKLKVTTIAIGLTLHVIFSKLISSYASLTLLYSSSLILIVALPLAYIKIFKRHPLVHNITELMIYPGIAAVFIPILGILGIIIVLLAISLYDIWAVWKSEVMQKMAKYQIEKLKFFTGFFVPYAG